jgi:hypothetical protein
MTAPARTQPRPAATRDAALPIRCHNGTVLVGVEGWPGSLAVVQWAARHAGRLIVATVLRPRHAGLPERDAELLRGDRDSVGHELMGVADHEPALEACAWLPTIADGCSPEALLECARRHACEAIVIESRDTDSDVSEELVRIANVPVIVVSPHAHTTGDES